MSLPVDAVRRAIGNVARADGALDVLSLVDIERDNLQSTNDGRWEWTDANRRSLKSTGKSQHLQIPLKLADDYRLRMRVQKLGTMPEEGLVLGLRIAGVSASMTLGYERYGKIHNGFEPPHVMHGERFPTDREFELEVTVKGRTVEAKLEGKTIFQFDGNPKELVGPGENYWARRDPTQLSLAAVPDFWRINSFEYLALPPQGAMGANPPAPAKAPFDAQQARAHQEAWAKHLGTTVETTNSVGAKMILIPPGEFLMGSSDEQIKLATKIAEETLEPSLKGRIAEERPQHLVRITKPFRLGAHEVTIGQFAKFAEQAKYKSQAEEFGGNSEAVKPQEVKPDNLKLTWRTPGYAVTDDSPVTQVNWNDAVAFCNWLSVQEKLDPCYQREGDTWMLLANANGYRLPTEAEWEYCCRAGTMSQFWFGDAWKNMDQFGWSKNNANGRPQSLGLLPANPFGLYDIHGNVWEWCHDGYDSRWYEKSPQNDPVGSSGTSRRVGRGGSWGGVPAFGRSAFRISSNLSYRYDDRGFRILRVLDTSAQTAGLTPSIPKPISAPQNGKPKEPAPSPAKAPFDAKQARSHQEAWAKHLGVPVEKEITLPGGEKLMMMLIPPGEFSRNEENQPSFRVELTKPFYLGKYEVTQAQWQSVMGNNPSQFQGNPDHPVEQVSWDDIQPFLAKLNAASALEKLIFGLPTEAQREFACRAGTTTAYSFGDDARDLSQFAWFKENSDSKTHAVGQLKPNPFGLFDIHGNVWELCSDWSEVGYFAKAPQTDPIGPTEGTRRVNRGGGWADSTVSCRSAIRGANPPTHRGPRDGFRLAASIDAVRQDAAATTELSPYALDFNDRLENGNARVVLPKMLRPNEACTVEMYFTARSVSDQKDNRVLFVNANGMQLVQQQMYLDWSGPLLAKQKDNRVRAKDAIKIGQRIHLAGVSAGKELRLFVDGQLVGQAPLINDLPSVASNCYLGSLPVNLDSFNPVDGLIDEVRISKGVRYTDNFKPASRFEADATTLALYHFDEGAGEVLKDSSGNNHHGEIIGAKWVKLSNASTLPAWTDWLGPRLKRNEIGGNGWIREGDAFTTDRDISGIAILPDTTRDGAIRLTYLLRDAKGVQINARDRKRNNTDAARDLYVAEDNGTVFRISLSQSGAPYKDLARQTIPASISKDAPRTLEFRVVGDTLTATLNGSLVVTAKDSTIPSGNFALVALKGLLVQKVEYQELDNVLPPLAIAPFDARQARAHQEAWAKHLGTTVETTNSVGAKMILIPPGEFLMGSSDEQVAEALKFADQEARERIENPERPQHRVVISRPFLLGATEVTVGQFKKFAATGYKTEAEQDTQDANAQTYLNPGYVVTDDSPVAVITKDDAAAYCKWLSEKEKTTYRLPTEAEWEYACRAGTPTAFSFGDDVNQLAQFSWHSRNAGGKSHPVGTKLSNAFGIFDMHGNLYEWVADDWDEKWYEKSPVKDPIGPTDDADGVFRGGSWLVSDVYCRSAARLPFEPSTRSSHAGFRVVRVLDAPIVPQEKVP